MLVSFIRNYLETAERLGLEYHALTSAPDLEALRGEGVESPSGQLVVDIARVRALSSGSMRSRSSAATITNKPAVTPNPASLFHFWTRSSVYSGGADDHGPAETLSVEMPLLAIRTTGNRRTVRDREFRTRIDDGARMLGTSAPPVSISSSSRRLTKRIARRSTAFAASEWTPVSKRCNASGKRSACPC